MANGNITARQRGQSTGRGIRAGVGGALQSIGGLGRALAGGTLGGALNLPQVAREEAGKALRSFFKGAAEELIAQPGGVEILQEQVQQAPEQQLQKMDQLSQLMAANAAQQSEAISPTRTLDEQPKAVQVASNAKKGAVSPSEGQQPAQPEERISQPVESESVTGVEGSFLQPVTEQGIPQPGILGRLIGLSDPRIQAQRLANAAQTQQLLGLQPLQAGEREVLEQEGIQKFQNTILKNTLDAEKAGTLKPNEIFSQFRKASGEFEKVRDAQARIEASATDPSPAGDLALIFNYMKVLDPGSTVREGEFANAQNSGGASDKIRNLYNNTIRGTRLSVRQRADFVSRSRRLFGAAERQQNKTVNTFSELARRNGIDPQNIIIDVGLAQEQQEPQQSAQVGRFKVRRR